MFQRDEEAPSAEPVQDFSNLVEQRGRRVTVRSVARFILVLVTLWLIGWLVWRSWSALLPFQVGAIVAYLTLPLVNRMEQFMPRWAAIALVYTGGLIVIIAAIAIIVPPLVNQATDAAEALPSFTDIEAQATETFEAVITFWNSLPEDVRLPIEDAFYEVIGTIQSNLTSYVQNVSQFVLNSTLNLINTVTFVLGFAIVPFWLFYVMKDQRQGVEAFNRMLPDWLRDDLWATLKIFDRVFSSYIRGQIVLGLLVGAAAWVGLTILDLAGFNVRYAILLAVIAGVTELIPIIGPVIGAIPAIAMGFFDSPTTALAVAILYALIQQLENNFLVPRIVGESVGIHPAILMIVLILFSQFGLLGIILSAPLAAVGRDIFRYVYGRLSDPPRPAGLLADEPPVIPEHELAPSGGQKTAVTANVQPPAELPTEPTNPDVPPPLPIQQPPPEQEQSATEERPSIASQSQEPL